MRKFIVCVLVSLFFLSVPAYGWNLEDHLDDGSLLGAGAMLLESPYKGVDEDIYPVPVLIF
ncbi:MAG: hypothetical protein WC547_07935, partial [Candidatus Omnitrophota bacterium]